VDGRSAKAHQLLGTLLMNRDQGDGAVWHLRQAVALNPSFQQAHNNLGLMLMARGHIDAAIDHFEQAARLGSRQAAENRHKAMALRSGRQPIENP
jgi:Flp pilus assembly protein TadD